MPDVIPKGITKEDVEQAIADYGAGASHGFGSSTKYDILHDGQRYPPKAIVGLAARRIAGRTLGPEDFKGGEESRCFRLLEKLGFEIVAKADQEQGSASRNPPWQRDELILALDLYFRHPPQQSSSVHPEVIGLSELLNALPIHAHRPDPERFRNPNGVYMKLNNFSRFDPNHARAGLTRGGKLSEYIQGQKTKLQDLALVCANCHRMLHRRRPWLSIKELNHLRH
jgi:hypothetical protein